MSKDGYYGDFDSAAEEAQEYAKYQQQQYEKEQEDEAYQAWIDEQRQQEDEAQGGTKG